MPQQPQASERPPSATGGARATGNDKAVDVHETVSQNIDAIFEFHHREAQKISRTQRLFEHLSLLVGRPLYLILILVFVCLWILGNLLAARLGYAPFDPPQFFWLQGLVSLTALLTSSAVLIRQNRMVKLAEQRAHLDLQINLLAEQKTSKIIELLEELRRDLPGVQDRIDPEAEALKQSADPHEVLDALEETLETEALQEGESLPETEAGTGRKGAPGLFS